MSKELEALNKLKRDLSEHYLSDTAKDTLYQIIETSLNEKTNIENRLDEIFKNHNIKSFTELNERLCDYNELKFDDDIKQKKLKALKVIEELFDFHFALRFPSNQSMLRITNKQTNEYWEIPVAEEKYNSLKKVLL